MSGVRRLTEEEARSLRALIPPSHASRVVSSSDPAARLMNSFVELPTGDWFRREIPGFGLLGSVALYESAAHPDLAVALKMEAADQTATALIRSMGPYRREFEFYAHCANDRVPACFASFIGGDDDLLLVFRGVRSPSPLNQVGGLSAHEVAAAVADLVLLQGGWSKESDYSALDTWGSEAYADLLTLYDMSVQGFATEFSGQFGPEASTLLGFSSQQLAGRVRQYLEGLAPSLQVCNFDLRADNVLRDGLGRHWFIDWQFASLGRGAMDLAHLFSTSVDVAVRRAVENDVCRQYTSASTAAGRPISAEEYRADMRMGVLTRLILCVVAVMNFPHPTEQSRAARRLAVERLLAMLDDFGPWLDVIA